MMIFPLRALANDQLAALERLGVTDDPCVTTTSFDVKLDADTTPIRVARHDGATPDHERGVTHSEDRLMVATPDSLHAAVLRMTMPK